MVDQHLTGWEIQRWEDKRFCQFFLYRLFFLYILFHGIFYGYGLATKIYMFDFGVCIFDKNQEKHRKKENKFIIWTVEFNGFHTTQHS